MNLQIPPPVLPSLTAAHSNRYSERIAELVAIGLAYIQTSPQRHPKERYYLWPFPRRWNLDLLLSSHKDLQTSFRCACIFYVDELLRDTPCMEQEVDILSHVHKLAVLYDRSKEPLETCQGFGHLLDECARVLRGSGKGDSAGELEEVAKRVRGERRTVCPRDLIGGSAS